MTFAALVLIGSSLSSEAGRANLSAFPGFDAASSPVLVAQAEGSRGEAADLRPGPRSGSLGGRTADLLALRITAAGSRLTVADEVRMRHFGSVPLSTPRHLVLRC